MRVDTSEAWDVLAARPDLHVCSVPYTFQPTVNRVLAAMPETGTVLDFGCGPGRLAVPVADARPDLNIVGLDISPRMLAQAPDHQRILYLHGDDIFNLGPIDGAWSVLVFQHLPPDVAAGYLGELATAIRPGGPLLVHFIEGDFHAGLCHQYQPDEIADMAQTAGFTVTDLSEQVDVRWWWLTATRNP